MRSTKPILLILVFALLSMLAGQAAESPQAVTATDPAIPNADLVLRLDPLTKQELAAEAAAWQKLLQAKVSEVSGASISTRAGKSDGNSSPDLGTLREQRAALAERFNTVLNAWDAKGGDTAELRKYLTAVSGIKTQITDIGSSWGLFSGWLTSKEGGIKWAIRIGQFIVVMVVFWILSSLISKVVSKTLERQNSISGLLRNFINTMSRRVVLLLGLVVALGTIGVNVGAALALIGGGAFVLAFALQDTLGNFANGMMLLIYRPFDVGDSVEVGGVTGKVYSVSLVNTTILTFDNKRVIVPNKSVWGEVITNITGMPTRRVDMTFGIGYNDDAEKARQILQRIVAENDMVLKDPETVIQLHELADSSVNFVCRPWVATADYWDVHWAVTRRVKEEFDAAGISIPFPQQDVYLHTVPSPEMPSSAT